MRFRFFAPVLPSLVLSTLLLGLSMAPVARLGAQEPSTGNAPENATPAASELPAPPPPPPPPEHASARSTMRTFLQSFDPRYSEPSVDPLAVAAGCLDLTAIPEDVRGVRGPELALDLKDVLDRTKLIVYEEIPDDPQADPYRLQIHEPKPGHPGVVTLAPALDGRWLFTAETVARIPAMLGEVSERELVEGVVREGPRTLSKILRDAVPESLRGSGFLLEHWQWLALLVLVFLGMILDRAVVSVVRVGVEHQLTRFIKTIDTERVEKALRPVGLLAAALLWWPGVTWLGLPTEVLTVLVVAARFIAASSMVWTAYRLVDIVAAVLEARAAKSENKLDDLLVPLISKTLKVFIAVFGLVFIADMINVEITSLLAGVGIGGLALALAAQDTVRNLFGSLMVILDQPFHVGDWVVIGEIEGTVAEVGFRSTRIRTFYDSMITLPNANLIEASVDNYGARSYRRWSTKLDIAYETPPELVEAFCEGIRELVRRHPYTRKDYYHCYFNEFGPASLKILLYVFFAAPDWSTELRERHRFALDIVRLANELGVEFAYPTQTLYLRRPAAAQDAPATEGWGARIEDARRGARGRARDLVDGALGGEIPPPVRILSESEDRGSAG